MGWKESAAAAAELLVAMQWSEHGGESYSLDQVKRIVWRELVEECGDMVPTVGAVRIVYKRLAMGVWT